MKAKKVYEMLDPYASEETDNMDLDVSYKKKLIEDWFDKWLPDVEYSIDKFNHIFIDTYVEFYKSSVDFLPENLTINGNLDIAETEIKILPKTLLVKGIIDATGSKIEILEPGIKITNSCYLAYTKIEHLPDNLTIGTNTKAAMFDLRGCPIKKLPRNLYIRGSLDVRETNLESVNFPKDIKILGSTYESEDYNNYNESKKSK